MRRIATLVRGHRVCTTRLFAKLFLHDTTSTMNDHAQLENGAWHLRIARNEVEAQHLVAASMQGIVFDNPRC